MATAKATGLAFIIAVIVAVIQVAGGVYGLLLLSGTVGGLAEQPALNVLIFALFVVLFLNSIVAGVQLMRRKGSGVVLSIINQILQLVQIKTASLWLFFISGPYVGVAFAEDGVEFSFETLVAAADISVPAAGAAGPVATTSINLLAVVILIWLLTRLFARRRDIETAA
ncbi:MAG: hypothetical protein AAF563_11935 [Pseudomonadota bacterium]